MYKIEVVCLKLKKTLAFNHQSIDQLEKDVFADFKNYLVNKKHNEVPVKFILTYSDKTTGEETLLTNTDPITTQREKVFQLSLKRIWDSCCICLKSFGITSGQQLRECQGKDCGYQYCQECVESIKNCNSQQDRMFYCLLCNHSSTEGPQENKFLCDLLWEQLYKKYGVDLLPKITMVKILSNDIQCRIVHVQYLIKTLNRKKPNYSSIDRQIKKTIDDGTQLVNKLNNLKKEIDTLKLNEDFSDDFRKQYENLLNGGPNSRRCQQCIELCEHLLYEIKKADFESYFPSLNSLMTHCELCLMNQNVFEPKVIDILKNLEIDHSRIVATDISPRVGFIGYTSAGKSSLMQALRTFQNYYTNNLETDQYSSEYFRSTIRATQSTFCPLEFEYEYAPGKLVTLVDIEGATDHDDDVRSGNYFDEINKADCDLYIIVFQDLFTSHHEKWYDYITKILKRDCWVVRNKIDNLFLGMFKDNVGIDFTSSSKEQKIQYGPKIIEQAKHDIKSGTKEKKLYLTYSIFHSNLFLSEIPYGKFDLQRLHQDITDLPITVYKGRLYSMSVRAIGAVVNKCLRRGYIINVLKYKIAASIAATIPFLDVIPRYLARKKIREVFGINSRSRFMNWLTKQTNEFEEYTKKFKIHCTRNDFTTSVFKEMKALSYFPNTETNVYGVLGQVGKDAGVVGIAGVAVSDDILRIAGVGAINAVRGLSIAFIIVGAGLTAFTCAWTVVDTGNKTYDYLNRLCDDIIRFGGLVADTTINKNYQTTEHVSTEIQ